MMNKKIFALLVAIATVSASTFAFIDDVVGGTVDTAGRVASAPVDALPRDDNKTWSERREERRQEREERRQNRQNKRQERRDNRYYESDYID